MSDLKIAGVPQWAVETLEHRADQENVPLDFYLRQLLINAARNPNIGKEVTDGQSRLTDFGD
ncbi:hypothetical protein [Haloglycomyces albus]|uniref:hypothetical protein n=1 Tax=Haloglycomyces albus TaxID=526067 RepID=UPI00046D1719|nr:hypothetical protein [Haloglycomyces albus]